MMCCCNPNACDAWFLCIYCTAHCFCLCSCYVLVYHLGGSSLDLTILEYINGLYKVLTSQHITDLGGQLFDAALTDYFRQEFQRYNVSCTDEFASNFISFA